MIKQEIIKATTPPTDDWEHYADRLHDIAYKRGYDDAMRVLEDIKAEIKEWYRQADKQVIAKDPCIVDSMVDLFIRTIDNHISRKEQEV